MTPAPGNPGSTPAQDQARVDPTNVTSVAAALRQLADVLDGQMTGIHGYLRPYLAIHDVATYDDVRCVESFMTDAEHHQYNDTRWLSGLVAGVRVSVFYDPEFAALVEHVRAADAEDEASRQRVALARQRYDAGYYDQTDVINQTVDCVMDAIASR